VLRTRRPLLALLLLGVLLAGGYLASAVRSDTGEGHATGPAASATSIAASRPSGGVPPGVAGV